MDSKSLQEHAKRVALEMPFTEHCWPFGPEYDVFKVGTEDITPELVADLIADSWNLVVDKLPKKDQKWIRPA